MMSKNITHHSLGLLYLSGGTSLLPGLHNWIQERLNVPTKPLLALSATTASGVTYSEHTDAHFLLAASLTLAWVGPDRSSCINFRKGEFTKQSRTREINFQAIKKPLLSAATVAFCLFSSLIIQSNIYRSRLTATNKQLESSIKSFFGQISGSALKNYLSNTAALRTSINKELMKQDELNRLFGPNARSPIHFLNSISSGIPKDVIVDLTQFQVGSSASEPFSPNSVLSASLTFLVANPQTAEKLATLLGNKMGHLQRGKMEEVDADGGLKKWKISFAGKPTEETYGK